MNIEIHLSQKASNSQQNQTKLQTVHTKKENHGKITICLKTRTNW
jgi:hypothetical protein